MVFKSLNKIYKTSKSVAESYGYSMIQLSLLAAIIDKAKISSPDLPRAFVDNYNTLLDVLYKTAKSGATKNDLVYPQHLKQYISEIKKEFTSAIS